MATPDRSGGSGGDALGRAYQQHPVLVTGRREPAGRSPGAGAGHGEGRAVLAAARVEPAGAEGAPGVGEVDRYVAAVGQVEDVETARIGQRQRLAGGAGPGR